MSNRINLFSLPPEMEGTALILVVGALIVPIGWLFLQFRRLRIQEQELVRNRSQQKRDDILDAHKKVRELEALGYSDRELERAKNQLFSTLESEQVPVDDLSVESEPLIQSIHRSNPTKLFLAGILQFGSFCIWSIGWGGGLAVMLIPSTSEIWAWSFSHEYGFWVTMWRTIALFFGAVALVGIWIIPTVGTFLISIAGILKMIAAIFPRVTLPIQNTRFTRLWQKYVLGDAPFRST